VISIATIGLDRLFYAKITEDADGNESYGKPAVLAKAIKAELSIELAEAVLYADDSAAFVVKDFKSGKLVLGVDDIGVTAAQDLTGAVTDENGVLVSVTEQAGSPVAIGFRARKPDGKYRMFWLYRVKFGIPSTNLETKGDSISFQTPSIEGTVMRRNRLDAQGNHPWKSEVTEGLPGTKPSVIAEWFDAVYEPIFSVNPEA
jgi:phi13 family phage major tail protein